MPKIKNRTSRVIAFLLSVRIMNYILPVFVWNIIFLASGNPENITLSWNRWDGPHYIYLAQHGYSPVGDEANFIVFQPLYPLVIRLLSSIILNPELAATIISIAAFCLAGVFFYKTIREEFDDKVAWRSIIFLSIFPTAYFFNAPYTESLFFLFASMLIYLANTGRLFLASLAGGLATLTRHIGIFLIIPLLASWWKNKKKALHILPFLPLAFIAALLVYLFINEETLGDPFAFNTILREHWQKSPEFFWKSIQSSWQRGLEPLTKYSLEIGLAEAIPATLSIFIIPLVYKIKKFGWFAYYSVYVVVIASTSFLLSTSRYLLLAFPLFVFFAKISNKSKAFSFLWTTISLCLLFYFSMRFVSGQWAF